VVKVLSEIELMTSGSEGCLSVFGQISADELKTLLEEKFPGRRLKVTEAGTPVSQNSNSGGEQQENELKEIYNELEQKKIECEEITLAATQTSNSIQAFTEQQQLLFDDFVLLRTRYDDQKATLLSTCCSLILQLTNIDSRDWRPF
jgi:hypothetical protein